MEGEGDSFEGDAAWAVDGIEGDGAESIRMAILLEGEMVMRLFVGLTGTGAAEDAGVLLSIGAGAAAELTGAGAAGAGAAGAEAAGAAESF